MCKFDESGTICTFYPHDEDTLRQLQIVRQTGAESNFGRSEAYPRILPVGNRRVGPELVSASAH